jgi:hypothetical protein
MGYRPRLRRSNQFDLYSGETVLGWRVLRTVSGAQGEEMVACGRWIHVFDADNNFAGYQILAPGQTDAVIPSKPTASGIARCEMEVNAGTGFIRGRSRTARLNEHQRNSRKHHETGKALPPEDFIERIQQKVHVWPSVTAAKQDIERVWPRE